MKQDAGKHELGVVMFDSDDYVYSFPSITSAQNWIEPLTLEEVDAVYDSDGRRLHIIAEGRGYSLQPGPTSEVSLGQRLVLAHGRGKLLDLNEHLALGDLMSLLMTRYQVRRRR